MCVSSIEVEGGLKTHAIIRSEKNLAITGGGKTKKKKIDS